MANTAAPMSVEERQAYSRMSDTMEYFVRGMRLHHHLFLDAARTAGFKVLIVFARIA